jgi:subtilisin
MIKRVLLLLLMMGMLVPGIAQASYPNEEHKFEVVVELDPTQDPVVYSTFFLNQIGVDTTVEKDRVNHIYHYAINGFSVFLTQREIDKAERLFQDGPTLGMLSLQLSEEVTLPVLTGVDGAMPPARLLPGSQVTPTGIAFVHAQTDQDVSDVDVAVIDTGVDKLHPDLNVVGGTDCTTDNPDDFGYDGFGHGTHVAGIIAARDNGEGVVGVAPGARIWSVRVLDDTGSGSTASVICGLDWVAEHSDVIDVANMSLGGRGQKDACDGTDPMHDAFCVVTEKTIVAVAAGNASSDAIGTSPANYAEAVTVSAYADFDGQPGGAGLFPADGCAAMSVDDELATFSNFGPDVDIAAPGTCILSTLPGELDADGHYQPQYGVASGTSMATPMVCGAIARYLAVNPDQHDYAVKAVLTWSAAHNPAIMGDHDGIHEPLLYVGDGAPRYIPPTQP